MTKTTRRRQAPSVQSPLETYLREINETSLLTADDEHQLAIAIGAGDTQARDRMVRANLRLVVNIARGYTGKGLSLQDLIEEGNLGLLRAVEGFDPAIGTRFSTYASYWIKQSIKRALINTAKTIRIPAYMVELLSKWRRATSRLSEELGRTPTPEEIARVLGLPRKKLPIIKKAIRIYNLTPQTDQADAGWSLGEMVMDDRARSPDEEMVESDNLTHVMQQLQTMDPREATVLRMRFRAGRQRTPHAQGDRRGARPDPRACPPDRDRSPRQAGREPQRPGGSAGSPRRGPRRRLRRRFWLSVTFADASAFWGFLVVARSPVVAPPVVAPPLWHGLPVVARSPDRAAAATLVSQAAACRCAAISVGHSRARRSAAARPPTMLRLRQSQ